MKFFIYLFFFSFALTSFGAPHPATSTSLLTRPDEGLFMISLGYQIKSKDIIWKIQTIKDSSNESFKFNSTDEKRKNALFIINTDKLNSQVTFDLYTKRWIRDYTGYGFDILTNKEVKINGSQGMLIDVYSKQKSKQIRQLVLNNKNKVAILTCSDDALTFNQTLEDCNKLINSFQWVSY